MMKISFVVALFASVSCSGVHSEHDDTASRARGLRRTASRVREEPFGAQSPTSSWNTLRNGNAEALVESLEANRDTIDEAIQTEEDLAELVAFAEDMIDAMSMEDIPSASPIASPSAADITQPPSSAVPKFPRGSPTLTSAPDFSSAPSVSSNISISPTTAGAPSASPSPLLAPSSFPSVSPLQITSPTVSPTMIPSAAVSASQEGDPVSGSSIYPSPSVSMSPSVTKTPFPSLSTSSVFPSFSTVSPSSTPTNTPNADLNVGRPSSMPSGSASSSPSFSFPTVTPTAAPTSVPSALPTATPSASSSGLPTATPSALSIIPGAGEGPSAFPSASSSASPSASPESDFVGTPTVAPTNSVAPTAEPTFNTIISHCRETVLQRSLAITARLSIVADPIVIRDTDTPQGKATEWIIGKDEAVICSDEEKLIQRWALAVIYFSTGGDDWNQCSRTSDDLCGFEFPFFFKHRFLSSHDECEWAGISCNADSCVTEIEFERNNLVGTVPSEIGLLDNLAIWGMERGGLTGPIPTTIASLTNLIFIDLDFNALSGSLPDELFTLTNLNQLDLNNNLLTGNIEKIGSFPNLEFLQIHANSFTGTIPETVGAYSHLETFTLHQTEIGGSMPLAVCDLLAANLTVLVADCANPDPNLLVNVSCACCTGCF